MLASLLGPWILDGIRVVVGLAVIYVAPKVVHFVESHLSQSQLNHLKALAAEYAPLVVSDLKAAGQSAWVKELEYRLNTDLKPTGLTAKAVASVAYRAILSETANVAQTSAPVVARATESPAPAAAATTAAK